MPLVLAVTVPTPPEIEQEEVSEEFQLSVVDPPASMVVGDADIDAVGVDVVPPPPPPSPGGIMACAILACQLPAVIPARMKNEVKKTFLLIRMIIP